MAEQLFLQAVDLKKLSALSGNIDDDKLIQWVYIAQEKHIVDYLGTDLYERLQAGIVADDLNAKETLIMNNYIKQMTVYWSLVEIMQHLPFTISNKGIFKHTSENSEIASKDEIDSLVENYREIAKKFSRRFVNYMCYNSSDFPEYDSNTNEDINPTSKGKFKGWVL